MLQTCQAVSASRQLVCVCRLHTEQTEPEGSEEEEERIPEPELEVVKRDMLNSELYSANKRHCTYVASA